MSRPSDGPDLRPARPARRRASSNGEAAPAGAPAAPDVLLAVSQVEALVRDGLDAAAHRQEELAELLEAAIDHLVAIERRLDTLEATRTPAANAPAAKAKKAVAAKKVAAKKSAKS